MSVLIWIQTRSFPVATFVLLLITFANYLDIDQDPQNVCPDLDPNSFFFQRRLLSTADNHCKQFGPKSGATDPNSFFYSCNLCPLLITFANCLGPAQDRLNVCPDLDPNSFFSSCNFCPLLIAFANCWTQLRID